MAVTPAQIVAEVEKFLGDTYVYGATGPRTFDCSGLMQYSYSQVGIKIPRTSQEQYSAFHKNYPGGGSASWLTPGDLVFTEFSGGQPDHVGMYVGKVKGVDTVVQAPHTGTVVQYTPLADFGSDLQFGRVPGVQGDTSFANPGAPGNVGGTGVANGQGSLFSWPGELVNFFGDAYKRLEDTYNFFHAFFQPSTYIRIGAGVFGFGFMLTGLILLMREAKP